MGLFNSTVPLPSKWEHLLPVLVLGTNGKRFSFSFADFPLSTPKEVVLVLAIYLSTLYILKSVMKNRPKMDLKFAAFVHNVFLSFGSGLLLILIASEMIPTLLNHGLFSSICEPKMFNGRLEYLFYINYLFKVYELFDTVLLVLKKHDLTFLHVYHHCLTFVLCYTQFIGQSSVQWVPITLNLIVHMFMYWYYTMTSIGVKVWWKRYLTSMQIIQFVVDIVACYYAASYLLIHTYLGQGPSCHGSEASAIFGCMLLTSYLWLFIDFYRKTYSRRSVSSKSNGDYNGKRKYN